MNDIETHSPAQGSDIEWQIAALQRQVFLLLLSLIVVTATVVFYLYYESHVLTTQLDQYSPQAQQVIQLYQRNFRAIANFENQLGTYAQTHQAFGQQVLKKYGWSPTATPPK